MRGLRLTARHDLPPSRCWPSLRDWLRLHAIGVHVSIFDSMALLIVMFTVGQLPIGPSTGPAASVLILSAHGIAATAAAGVLVTLTGIVGSLAFVRAARATSHLHLGSMIRRAWRGARR